MRGEVEKQGFEKSLQLPPFMQKKKPNPIGEKQYLTTLDLTLGFH